MILQVSSVFLLIAFRIVSAQYEFTFSPDDDIVADKINDYSILRSANDVTFHFYTKRHPSNSVKFRISTVEFLYLTDFDYNKDTLFIIHGWRNHNESDVNYKIREKILSKNDLNVFVVDWSPIAGKSYRSAKNSVVRVGEYVAEFVWRLKEEFYLDVTKVKFVGHSLGAHVAGNAGAALGGIVDRIVGLDPAGPYFKVKDVNNRLDPTDARFVSVIHTNGGRLGFGVSMGHADYWPNGGKSQPGCGFDLFGTCAHSRAYAYYAESLTNSSEFIAMSCSSYSDFSKNKCANGEKSFMGKFKSDYSARGDYYLTTNKNSPYAKN